MKSRKKSSMTDPVDAGQLYEHLQAVIRDSEALLKASASYAGDKIDVAKVQAAETLASAKERLAREERTHNSSSPRRRRASARIASAKSP